MNQVVLLHGFLGCPAQWDAVREQLPMPQRSACKALWLPGHGPNADALSNAEDFETAADRMLDQIPVGAWLVGYSLGARIALSLVVRHTNRVAGAILIGAHPGLTDLEERRQRAELDAERSTAIVEEGLASFVDRWEALPLFATQANLSPQLRVQQRQWRLAHRPEAVASTLIALGLGRMPAYGRRAATSALPITWIVGENDVKFGQIARVVEDDSLRLGGHVVFHTVRGAGHNAVIEAPDYVARLIVDTVTHPAPRAATGMQ